MSCFAHFAPGQVHAVNELCVGFDVVGMIRAEFAVSRRSLVNDPVGW